MYVIETEIFTMFLRALTLIKISYKRQNGVCDIDN